MTTNSADYVQYGCGLSAPDGWVNFDSSPSLRVSRLPVVGKVLGKSLPPFPRAVRFGDIVKGLPVPAGSCRGVYASHVLEHLSLEDCRTALANTLKILKPGGCFRLLVPDLKALVTSYLSDGRSEAALTFMRHSMLGRESRPRGPSGRVREALGNSHHLWMWDFPSLAAECHNAGFTRIRPCSFGDADDPAFHAVESVDRFTDAVAIEARKPEVAQ